MEADPDAGGRLITERGIPRATLVTLSRIGKGDLLPELAFKPAMGRLPAADQKRIVEGTVDAVVIRNGKTETIKVDLRNAVPAMVDQIVAQDHIRTLPEQVQYIETRRAGPVAAATTITPLLLLLRRRSCRPSQRSIWRARSNCRAASKIRRRGFPVTAPPETSQGQV
jgi:hypothetical protein